MARTKKDNAQNTINIKSLPVQAHIGASKYVNDDWGTIAFIIPRNQLQLKFVDKELRYNCIYFLFGYEGTTEKVYVGQAKKRNNGESVLARLREHDTSTTERYCDIWEWVVVCTGKEDTWSLDDLNALEHAFYNEISIEQSLNGNNPNSGGANYEAYTDKIKQIKNYITSIGFNIFADNEDTEKIQVTSEVNENTIVEDLQNSLARIPEIVTPHKIVKAMCDMLPPEVWNDQTVFLDPACKGGEYLREIYDRLMDSEIMQVKYPDEFERSNHILGKQLYGIALSRVSLERTTKKLRGYDHNLRVIPNYIRKLKGICLGSRTDGTSKTIQDILNEEFNKDMKFDVVIGNPPYQENNGEGNGRQTKPLYDRFISLGISLSQKYIVFITNNTFLTNDSKKALRNEMINNGLKKLYNYPLGNELFKGVGVSTCIFQIDKYNHEREFEYRRIENNKIVNEYNTIIACGDIIAESKYELDIPKKINTIKNMGSIVLGDKVFGIASNGTIGFTGSGDSIDVSLIEFVDCIKLKNKIQGFESIDFIEKIDVPKGKEYIDTYKVICPRIVSKQSLQSLERIEILEPKCICTENWSVLGVFCNIDEAYNLVKYMKTRLVKYLIYIFCSNAMTKITKVLMEHAPLQDFTSNSDIDWSQSISDIDQQLFKKYNLTQEEIDYIEKTIKPME